MVERAIIRWQVEEKPIIELEDSITESPESIDDTPIEPELEISWFGSHPGDKVESFILQQITEKLKEDAEQSFNNLFARDGILVYIVWYTSKIGVVLIHDPLELTGVNLTPTVEWASYVIHFKDTKANNWETFFPHYLDPGAEIIEYNDIPMPVNLLKKSLEGSEIELKWTTKSELINQFTSLINHFPWSVYLLSSGAITDSELVLTYYGINEQSESIPYDEIHQQLYSQTNQAFWNLLRRGLTLVASFPQKERFVKIRRSLLISYLVTQNDIEVVNRLEYILKYIADLLELDVDYTIQYVNQSLQQVSTLTPSVKIAGLLLDVASAIIEQNFADLAKLAEGTALQVAFMLDSKSAREKIILQVTERSKVWGTNHLVGYIQSITGILAETPENRKILAKVVELTSDLLTNSWDGVLCLVETALVSGETMKAVELRLNATNLITEKFARAEDISNAMIWALEQGKLDEEYFISMARPLFVKMIHDLPIGEAFINEIMKLVEASLTNNKNIVLSEFINWFKQNLIQIAVEDRKKLIAELETRLRPTNQFELQIDIKILKFSYYLAQDEIDQLGDAEGQLRSIFNLLDPNKENFKDLITNITTSLISVSAQAQLWDLILETIKRFQLMIKDENYTQKVIFDSYMTAARERSLFPKRELKRNDIGLKLFDEAVKIGNKLNLSEKVFESLPYAKKLALKLGSYNSFANYAIIETNIARSLNVDWLTEGIDSAKILIEKGATESAKVLFTNMLSFDVTPEEEYELISAEVDLVELDPDFLSSDEISKLQTKLIDLASKNKEVDPEEVVNHYRNSISILMAKGDSDRLNKFLLDAIKFTLTNNLDSINEFSSLLLDAYAGDLETYGNTGNFSTYKELIKITRMIYSTFCDTALELPFNLTNMLFKTNLDLYQSKNRSEFIRRAQLSMVEFSYLIADSMGNDIVLSETQQIDLLENYDKLNHEIIHKHPNFGLMSILTSSAIFYKNIGKLDSVYLILDEVLMTIKKNAIKSKQITTTVIVGILAICDLFISTDAEFNDAILSEIQSRATRLLETILSMPKDVKQKKITNNLELLKDKLEGSPREALQEFPFSIEEYLKEIDYSL